VPDRRGLPDSFTTRHDRHYVDAIGEIPETIGQMVEISRLSPNPDQPREHTGDLSGLKDSIREKGIIEPLVIKRAGKHYVIISGERRYRAALELGLEKLPCIIRESDQQDTLEVALIENLQRKDLTPFEEAEGLSQLASKFNLSHEEISKKIGKSRTSVTETLSLSAIPEDIRTLCLNHGITAKSMLLQIARQETHAEMLALAQQIIQQGMKREEARTKRKTVSTKRPKPFTFRKRHPEGKFTLTVKFKKSEIEKQELIEALKAVLADLEKE
jgi:ParB family chromosome partitioning protein